MTANRAEDAGEVGHLPILLGKLSGDRGQTAQRRVLRARFRQTCLRADLMHWDSYIPTKLLATLGNQRAIQLHSSIAFLLKRGVLSEKDQRSDLSPSALDLNGSWVAASGV